MALALQNGTIPPTINYRQANPGIMAGPFYIADTTTDFAPTDHPHRAAVSSWDWRTNAHAILEQAPVQERCGQDADASIPGETGYLVPLPPATTTG